MSSVAFSVISAIIAVVALIQTQSQIKLSNKHQLFERRLNNFFAFYGLYELYKENKVIIYFLKLFPGWEAKNPRC